MENSLHIYRFLFKVYRSLEYSHVSFYMYRYVSFDRCSTLFILQVSFHIYTPTWKRPSGTLWANCVLISRVFGNVLWMIAVTLCATVKCVVCAELRYCVPCVLKCYACKYRAHEYGTLNDGRDTLRHCRVRVVCWLQVLCDMCIKVLCV